MVLERASAVHPKSQTPIPEAGSTYCIRGSTTTLLWEAPRPMICPRSDIPSPSSCVDCPSHSHIRSRSCSKSWKRFCLTEGFQACLSHRQPRTSHTALNPRRGIWYHWRNLGTAGSGVVFFFSFTFVTRPRRSVSLKLNGTRVYEPQIRARLGTTA